MYICIFTIPWPKVPLAPGSEIRMWYFQPGYDETSYTQHGDKEGHPIAYVTNLAFGSGGNLHMLWTVQLFTSLVHILLI